MRLLRNVWLELVSLLVDDGFLAIAALVAIAATWALTRDGAIGTSDLAGWILFMLLAGSVVISVRRAVAGYTDAQG